MSTKPVPETIVFLSYAHSDWQWVEQVVKAFEAWEWTVSSDRDDLSRGESWRADIHPRVVGAYTLIVALSGISVKSTAVLDEVRWAREKERTLKFLPIIIEPGVDPPPDLWTEDGLDLSTWRGDPHDKLFERVRVAVENPWTIDSGMALIRDMKALKPIQVIKRRSIVAGEDARPKPSDPDSEGSG